MAKSKNKPASPETEQAGHVTEQQDAEVERVINNEALMARKADEQLPEAGVTDKAMEEGIEPAITLDSHLSIQHVLKLYDKLKKAYSHYEAIEIDASQVASIDTATLQLFVALKKDALKQNKQVDFFQPSARFVESARLLGLVDILEIIDV